MQDESTIADIGLRKEGLLVSVGRLRGGARTTRSTSSAAAGNCDPAESHHQDRSSTPSAQLAGALQRTHLGDLPDPPVAEKDSVPRRYRTILTKSPQRMPSQNRSRKGEQKGGC